MFLSSCAPERALHVLHDDVVAALVRIEPVVEDLHDVRVHETRGRLGLALEALHELRIVGEVLGQELHGDGALQATVERLHDARHAARADALAELVAPDQGVAAHRPSPWLSSSMARPISSRA